MTLSEAEKYSDLLRKAGFYATAMWHWGMSGYAVVVANKLTVISTKSEMLRWMQMNRVVRLTHEREQQAKARASERVGGGKVGFGDEGEEDRGCTRDHGGNSAATKPGSDYSV